MFKRQRGSVAQKNLPPPPNLHTLKRSSLILNKTPILINNYAKSASVSSITSKSSIYKIGINFQNIDYAPTVSKTRVIPLNMHGTLCKQCDHNTEMMVILKQKPFSMFKIICIFKRHKKLPLNNSCNWFFIYLGFSIYLKRVCRSREI